MKKNVLVLCPHPDEKGGVADYNYLLRKHFFSDRISLDFYHTGKTRGKEGCLSRLFKTLTDLFSLIKRFPNYELIVFNPSLDARAVIRDGVYHLVAKRLFHRRTLVLLHGWDRAFEHFVASYGKRFFRFLFSCNRMLVLAGQFRDVLVDWGFPPEIVGLETTTYEQHESGRDRDIFKIVFLSRFTKNKGCLESIRTVEMLAKEFPDVKLYMVGDGPLTGELKTYVTSRGLGNNVEFTGWLQGEEKYDLLNQCGIMLFPTSYGEGMPISVIEGMGMGLAVLTRPVAGIRDIFCNGENGFLVQTTDPSDFACKVRYLFQNRADWERISAINKRKAEENFEIRSVVKRIELLYFELAG
ncbi:glycosyltransferase family 1 protein [bacterium]|nr:glycosyltransferase family 1 protein [bacterium]